MHKFSLADPVRLSLSNSFSTLMFQLVDQTTREKTDGVLGALPKVCLVVSQSHRVSEIDFESAQNQLQGSLKQFPDLYFVFLSNDINTFKDMTGTSTNPVSGFSFLPCRLLSVNFGIRFAAALPTLIGLHHLPRFMTVNCFRYKSHRPHGSCITHDIRNSQFPTLPPSSNPNSTSNLSSSGCRDIGALSLRLGGLNSVIDVPSVTRYGAAIDSPKDFVALLQGGGREAFVEQRRATRLL